MNSVFSQSLAARYEELKSLLLHVQVTSVGNARVRIVKQSETGETIVRK